MLPMFLVMTAPLWGLLLFVFLPLGMAIPLYVLATVVGIAAHVLMARSAREPVKTGVKGLVGKTTTVVSWGGLNGIVRCRGELWAARCADACVPTPGVAARVVGVHHLTLDVVSPDGLGSNAAARDDHKSEPCAGLHG